MNRSRFNSPMFSSVNRNSPDSNWQANKNNNNGLRGSLSPDFIPFEYSSPLSSFKTSDNRHRRNFNRGPMRCNKSFNSPQSGGSNFSSPYNNSAFNQSGDHRKNFNNRQRTNHNPNNSVYNSRMYFNDSMIRDPWEDLEKQMKEEKEFTAAEKNGNDAEFDNESDGSSNLEDDDSNAISSSD